MTDLKQFLGSTSVVGRALSYVVDGVPIAGATGRFTEISPSAATLTATSLKIFGVTLVEGSLSLTLDTAPQATLTVTFTVDTPEGRKTRTNTIAADYSVNGDALTFVAPGSMPTYSFYVKPVAASIAGQTNTQLFAKDGVMTLDAILVPAG